MKKIRKRKTCQVSFTQRLLLVENQKNLTGLPMKTYSSKRFQTNKGHRYAIEKTRPVPS
jgi:hypothetical protein